jgi:hypothetical protein
MRAQPVKRFKDAPFVSGYQSTLPRSAGTTGENCVSASTKKWKEYGYEGDERDQAD